MTLPCASHALRGRRHGPLLFRQPLMPMTRNILLLEDVHGGATALLETLPGAHIVRLKRSPW